MNNPQDKDYLTYQEIKKIKEKLNPKPKSDDHEIKLSVNTIFPKLNIKKLNQW